MTLRVDRCVFVIFCAAFEKIAAMYPRDTLQRLFSRPFDRLSKAVVITLVVIASPLAIQAEEKSVDFKKDIEPILQSLTDDERALMMRWATEGAPLPEGGLDELPESSQLHGDDLFELEIAPILVEHCLECHDTNSREGALDLSRKRAAFKGGDSGEAIIPGDARHSSLWELVESDDMPEDRPPLSPNEKNLLRRWIDEGASWSVDWIDPAIYEREGGNEQWVRRLTVSEYIETIRSAVDVDVEVKAKELLPPDLRADGFSNTAYNLNVDLGHVSAYSQLASIVVEQMDILRFAKRFHKNLKFTDKEMGALIEKMGKWLLRGPLDEEEVILFRGISTTVASSGGSLEEAIGYIVEAMLQSPRFIYRMENDLNESSWISEYELASRLSYAIWGAPPDQTLMNLAEESNLSNTGTLTTQAKRMLEDPRAIERSAQFAYEWLDLARMDNLRPNSELYPEWNSELAVDMRAETLAFFEEIVWDREEPLSNLLNAQVTFVTPELAKHYGLNHKKGVETDAGLFEVDLASNASRGGLLTQGSVLTIGGDNASMVTRGLFVLHDLLRGTVKDPPPCLDTTPVPSSKGQSQRVISEERIANNSCGGCHEKFEPLAFGLERFNGLGSYYKRDVFGNKLREDGEILFPGEREPIKYRSIPELMDVLASSDRVGETITWKLAQFVLGHPLGAREASEIKKIHQIAQDNGGTYSDLIVAILSSDLNRRAPSKS